MAIAVWIAIVAVIAGPIPHTTLSRARLTRNQSSVGTSACSLRACGDTGAHGDMTVPREHHEANISRTHGGWELCAHLDVRLATRKLSWYVRPCCSILACLHLVLLHVLARSDAALDHGSLDNLDRTEINL